MLLHTSDALLASYLWLHIFRLILENTDGIVSQSIASQCDSPPASLIGLYVVLIGQFIGGQNEWIGAVLCESEGFLSPNYGIDDFSELFYIVSILSDHSSGYFFQSC